MLYKKVLGEINENREKRLRGESVTIPWSLPRLSEVLPGIERRRYNLVSAPPKGGKTQLADFLYMYEPIEWLEANPQANIKLKIFYFSLEISKEAKIRSAITHKLFKDYGIIISPQKLLSVFNKYILSDHIKEIIESPGFTNWFDKFESVVEVIDNIRNPYGIYNYVRNFAEQNGTYTSKIIHWVDAEGQTSDRTVRDTYVPDDPNLFVIIILDHISLLQTEKNQSLHQAIGAYSSEYCLHMREKVAPCYSNVA